jgi:HK97 family phage major capsid protein
MSDTATPTAITTATRAALPTAVRDAVAGPQKRSLRLERSAVDEEARTVELAFASDVPYERWWGVEILDCTAAAVNLERLNGRHPLLLNHATSQQIGVVEKAWVDSDRKCRALVRFSRSALGQEIFQDVIDGIRELVSVGYAIDDLVLESRTDDTATYRVTRWTPFEVSIVPVPADASVGVGRSLAAEAAPAQPKEIRMSDTTTAAPAAPQQPDIRVVEDNARKAERERAQAIRAMGSAHQLQSEAEAAVNAGTDVDAFRTQVLAKLEERGALKPAVKPVIGMTDSDKRNFSITRLMYALLEPNDREAQKRAGFEIECSVAARKLRPIDDKDPMAAHRNGGFTVPIDVLEGQLAREAHVANAVRAMLAQRDLTVGTPTAGGNLVATDLLASNFIDLLRNRMVLAQLGATVLDGLTGNIAIPSQTAGASTYWVTEGNAPTESQAAFGQVTLTPKTVGMFTDYSRKTLLQATPAIETLVRADLAMGLAVEIDRAGLAGSGSGAEPRGVINTPGIGAVAGGAAGAAPTYAHMVALEEAVAIANADIGAMAYCTNAKMRAQLKLTQVFSGTNGAPTWNGQEVNGYRAVATNSMPSNLVKGGSGAVCSAIAFGNWADLLMGFWSGLDLILDPYALATSGGRRLIALQDCDVAVRRAASFAAMLDALRT